MEVPKLTQEYTIMSRLQAENWREDSQRVLSSFDSRSMSQIPRFHPTFARQTVEKDLVQVSSRMFFVLLIYFQFPWIFFFYF